MEPIIQQRRDTSCAECVNAAARQLDRQGHPVKVVAYLSDDWCVCIAEFEAAMPAAARSTNNRTAGKVSACAAVSAGDGAGASSAGRRYTPSPSFAADRRYVDPGRFPKDLLDQNGGRVDGVFATVEHDQHALVGQECRDAGRGGAAFAKQKPRQPLARLAMSLAVLRLMSGQHEMKISVPWTVPITWRQRACTPFCIRNR